MTASTGWFAAFPIKPATEAVEALRQGWIELAKRPRDDFNPKTEEVKLTKRLKIYVENYIARERGLLGIWAAEDIIGEIDPITGSLIEERRTDIVYGWNDSVQNMKLVFEFKRLGRQKKYRDHYFAQDKGLGRFVTGIYSRKQAIAAMVGVLLDPESEVVPPIRAALGDAILATALRLRNSPTGAPYTRPSIFFHADFDTEHERDVALAPVHGTICVSHFFFAFGYPTSTLKSKNTTSVTKT